ncbi:fungal-specific transcription factor domain-containing protein [Mycena galericulata]|nr:fungal-specific transcription factor domain-containing protein [Mycena galericulata]
MPQAVKKDISSQRAQEKESKRARGALSCAECRRLKLKCDKTVPCSRYFALPFSATCSRYPGRSLPEYERRMALLARDCKRRGCSAICPNGSLITGQGTRFVLADTEKLHSKIATMSDRIRLLEDALAILQSTVTSDPHPLLDRELLKIKSSIELHSAVEGEEGSHANGGGDGGTETEDFEEYIDAFGTLAIREDGAATFYGRSAGSESLLMGEGPSPSPSPMLPQGMSSSHALAAALGPSVLRRQDSHGHTPSTSITSFTSSFPFATAGDAGIDLDYLTSRLPSYAESVRLCELYLAQAPWFFGAVTRDQLTDEILPLWFPDEAPRHTTRGGSPPPVGTAHDLALIYVIFCFGALGDAALPFPTSHGTGTDDLRVNADGLHDAEFYYRLTKAALTLEPVLEGPPSVATVQTLALMGIFEGLCAGENSIESTWAIFGLSTKLAQSIGLHRDCARWGLKPAEVQKRRALFWELFITDCWQALATGRLPTFSLPFVDCELPQDVGQTLGEDGTTLSSFPYWKARFGAECVSAVVQGTLTSRAPRYAIILELDRKVRDMELPKYATGSAPEGLGLSQTMSHFMPINYRHLTLLYIHRCFFAHAISNHPNDPIKSPYAPSFLAGYRSACDLLASLRQSFSAFPAEIARFWVLWTHAFSSAIMLSSVVTHATRSKVAPAALLELGKACELFEAAAKICPNSRAGKPRKFSKRHNGAPSIIPNNIFEPSRPDASNDELSIFSGKTHTLTNKSKPPRAIQPSASSSSSARSLSDSPRQSFTDNPSFAGVHPSLVDELNVFDGRIDEQIQSGYYQNGVYSEPMILQAQHDYRSQGQAAQYEQRLREQQLHEQQLHEQQLRDQQLRDQQLREHEDYRRQREEELRFRQQQQQQQQLRQQQPHHQTHHPGDYAYQPPPQAHDPYSPPHGVVAPVPTSPADAAHSQGHPQHALVHSRSQRNLRQVYHQQPPHQQNTHQQPPHQLSHSHSQTNQAMQDAAPRSLPHSHSRTNLHHAMQEVAPRSLSHSQSHRSLRQEYESQWTPDERAHHEQYGAPPVYKRHPSQMQSPTESGSSSSSSLVTSPEAPYMDTSPVHSPYQTMNPHYWPDGYTAQSDPVVAQPRGYEMQQQDPRAHRVQLDQQMRQVNLQLGQPQMDHYTPDGALRAIAAEDPRLQEHWQTYMSKVGSPRMIQDA